MNHYYFRCDRDKLKMVFKKSGLDKNSELKKGISEYILTKFYLKKKKEFTDEKLP